LRDLLEQKWVVTPIFLPIISMMSSNRAKSTYTCCCWRIFSVSHKRVLHPMGWYFIEISIYLSIKSVWQNQNIVEISSTVRWVLWSGILCDKNLSMIGILRKSIKSKHTFYKWVKQFHIQRVSIHEYKFLLLPRWVNTLYFTCYQ
jgi:hypothetical protein